MSSSGSTIGRFPCEQCGAQLEYQPGTTQMKCPYCGHQQPIPAPVGTVVSLEYDAYLNVANLQLEKETETTVRCNSCGAQFSVPPNQETKECPFCGSRVIVPVDLDKRIAPNGLLPFAIIERQAREKLTEWIGSRFWAPNDLKSMALKEGRLKGMYIPFWTYDCDTQTTYTGMRGDAYYVEVPVTSTDSDGNTTTEYREERRINWYPAAGMVEVPFEDVMVLGSRALPETQARKLRQWDLGSLTPYEPKFLMGFQTMRYDVDLAHGFNEAQQIMDGPIVSAIRYDIGGDEQQIFTKSTEYFGVMFKHLLLPIWVGGFHYRGKPYRVVVNGRTGEVQGEAPISVWKVLIAVILAILVIGVILMVSQHGRH